VGAAILTIMVSSILYYFIATYGFSGETEAASSSIIQLDSFIGAGLIVEFYYVYQRWEEEWRKKPRKDEPNLIAGFTPSIFGFVLSGLTAIFSTLTLRMEVVGWALGFFMFAIINGVWVTLRLQERLKRLEEENPP